MKIILRGLIVVLLAAVSPAQASSEQQQLVDQARIAVERLLAEPTVPSFPALMAQAKAVLVVPELVKAGFILGGEGGLGVLLVRDPETGAWSPPAFYAMAAASFGSVAAKLVFSLISLSRRNNSTC